MMDTENTVDISGENTQSTPQNTKSAPKRPLFADLYDCFETVILAACTVLLLFCFIIRPTRVDGSSMCNTLQNGQTLLISDLFYKPDNGDIVVFQNHTTMSRTSPLVKRVIAKSGQWIDIVFNSDWTMTVRVADSITELDSVEPLTEDYAIFLRDATQVRSSWSFPLQVPEGYYFCMGDNRNHSLDSRDADIGLVSRDNIIGRVVLRITPLGKFGPVA